MAFPPSHSLIAVALGPNHNSKHALCVLDTLYKSMMLAPAAYRSVWLASFTHLRSVSFISSNKCRALHQLPLHHHWNSAHTLHTSASADAAAATPSSSGGGKKTPLPRIGFIGAGQMGEALIRGFLSAGISSAGRISASVRTFERAELLLSLGIGNVFDDSESGSGCADVAKVSDIVFLGVSLSDFKNISLKKCC